jgi:cholesterol oxidase
MKGYIGFGAPDPETGFRQGLANGTYFEHALRIAIDDIDHFTQEPTHTAALTGHIECEQRFGGACPVLPSSAFNMFVDAVNPAVKYMFYRLAFDAHDGTRFTMLGHKTMEDDPGFDVYKDLTTLEVRVFAGDVAGPDVATPALGPPPVWPAPPVAMGVLHIHALDSIKSVLTFRSDHLWHLPGAVEKFCAFYGRNLWAVYKKFAA